MKVTVPQCQKFSFLMSLFTQFHYWFCADLSLSITNTVSGPALVVLIMIPFSDNQQDIWEKK